MKNGKISRPKTFALHRIGSSSQILLSHFLYSYDYIFTISICVTQYPLKEDKKARFGVSDENCVFII